MPIDAPAAHPAPVVVPLPPIHDSFDGAAGVIVIDPATNRAQVLRPISANTRIIVPEEPNAFATFVLEAQRRGYRVAIDLVTAPEIHHA